MRTTTDPTDPTDELEAPPPAHRPGYCSIHRTQRLVTHRQAGNKRWWGDEDPAVVCVMPHDPDDEERCRWCGGPLYPPPAPPYWKRSFRRAFCTNNHRLRAHRAGKAAA